MQILQPIVHETVWGGAKLAAFVETDCRKIGHLYGVIDTMKMRSKFLTGPYRGRTIHEWFVDNRNRYGLGNFEELPILTALVEAADNLSIQVHPDDGAARELEGKVFGKNESFYLPEPPTTGRMFNGVNVQTVEEFRRLIEENNTLDGVGTVEVHAGDYVYVTGGTLHAAAAGSLSFEIEENCDSTYRFYDFNRLDKNGNKRPLQVEKALASLKPELKSEVSALEPNSPRRERMYELTLVKNRDIYACEGEMFGFVVLLSGETEIDGLRIKPGTSVLMEPGDVIAVKNCTAMVAKPIPYAF